VATHKLGPSAGRGMAVGTEQCPTSADHRWRGATLPRMGQGSKARINMLHAWPRPIAGCQGELADCRSLHAWPTDQGDGASLRIRINRRRRSFQVGRSLEVRTQLSLHVGPDGVLSGPSLGVPWPTWTPCGSAHAQRAWWKVSNGPLFPYSSSPHGDLCHDDHLTDSDLWQT
jgi:hypothetical protein